MAQAFPMPFAYAFGKPMEREPMAVHRFDRLKVGLTALFTLVIGLPLQRLVGLRASTGLQGLK